MSSKAKAPAVPSAASASASSALLGQEDSGIGKAGDVAVKKAVKHARKQLDAHLQDMEEELKLQYVKDKYLETVASLKKAEWKAGDSAREIASLKSERKTAKTELSRAVAARGKLEALCRELQKQNKLIEDVSSQRELQEREKRKELQTHFETSIGTIKSQLVEDEKSKSKMAEDHMKLRTQMQELLKQYENREKEAIAKEQHNDALVKSKDLERQLAEAKLAQAEELLRVEKSKNLTLQQQHIVLQEGELAMTTKLKDAMSTFKETSTMFAKYRADIESLSKANKTLTKKNTQLEVRSQKAEATVYTMATTVEEAKAKLQVEQAKATKLERLCRALSARKEETTQDEEGSATKDDELKEEKDAQKE
eukprot:m.23815 g.23815  ORF g.23815 m.23815 type:complete len:367 (+) comp7543_c0_seq1:135-1235(+)